MPVRRMLPVTILGETMLWVAALLTLVTGYDYLRAGLRHISLEQAQRDARRPAPHGRTPSTLGLTP